jgi:hypothetical protein
MNEKRGRKRRREEVEVVDALLTGSNLSRKVIKAGGRVVQISHSIFFTCNSLPSYSVTIIAM